MNITNTCCQSVSSEGWQHSAVYKSYVHAVLEGRQTLWGPANLSDPGRQDDDKLDPPKKVKKNKNLISECTGNASHVSLVVYYCLIHLRVGK